MQDGNRNRTSWLRFSGVGFEFVGAVVVFALIGLWVDAKWNTRPWALIICVALGLIGATYNLLRETKASFRSGPPGDRKDTPGKDA